MASLDNLMDKVMILTYFLCWISILATNDFTNHTPLFYRYHQPNAFCDTEYYRSLNQKKSSALIEVILNGHHVQYLNRIKNLHYRCLTRFPCTCAQRNTKNSVFLRWMDFKRSSERVNTKELRYNCTCFCQIWNRFAVRNRDNLNFLISEFFKDIKCWNSIDIYIK